MIRLGVDVGGTNTDAVLLKGGSFVAGCKCPTTPDILSGVHDAIAQTLSRARIAVDDVDALIVGTTHFVNALVRRKELAKTGLIRLCLPSGGSLPPFSDWPEDLVLAMSGGYELVHGGYEMTGQEIWALDKVELTRAAEALIAKGAEQLAISCVFSTVRADMEIEAFEHLAKAFPKIGLTKSTDIGRLGLLERENAALINGALCPLASEVVSSFETLRTEALALRCPLFFTRNDGTLISAEQVKTLPVLTFACGPTNSMRGAAYLSGIKDGLVADVGGTTLDVGEVQKGFPRPAGTSVNVADVQTNFSMPDVISVGLGGGSLVDSVAESVGPDSVGHRLLKEGIVFGGSVLTASDLAVASGRATMGTAPAPKLDNLKDLVDTMDQIAIDAIARSRTSAEAMTIIAVGGGAVILPNTLDGLPVVRPENYDLANAIGAAIAQVSGEATQVISLEGDMTREQAIENVAQEARTKAIEAGAAPESIQILSQSDIPLAYLPGSNLAISVTVVGDLSTLGSLS